jgi:hypothetical protein
MSRIVKHPKIGKVEVLIESEMNYESGTKFFALIRTKSKPVYSKRYSGYGYQILEDFKPQTVYQHYILWGNTPEFECMGITHLLTPGLRPVRGSRPVNLFFEMIRNAEFMEFVNKTKIID